MTKIFQTRFGREGNCWAACLASYFEVPLEEVDQCACHNIDWREKTHLFLAARGLFYVEVSLTSDDNTYPFTAPLDGSLVIIGVNVDIPTPHVVIGRTRYLEKDASGDAIQFDIVHDPLGEDITHITLRNYHPQILILFCHLSV